jgi:hypothetical protein
MGRPRKLLTVGQRYGSREVLGPGENYGQNTTSVVRCECGEVSTIPNNQIRRGDRAACLQCATKKSGPTAGVKRRLRPFEAMFNRLLRSAKWRGITCDLTLEQFQDLAKSKACHYCTAPLEWSEYTRYLGKQAGCNLDRKDNDARYSVANCVPCCWSCNNKKKHKPYAQFWNDTRHLRETLHGEFACSA